MKKNTSVVIGIILIFVLVLVAYLMWMRMGSDEVVVRRDIPFHTTGFPLEARFYSNQLVVLSTDGTLAFYDIATQKTTPYTFPEGLFDSIYHFSFTPAKNRAYVAGTKNVEGSDILRYALIDLEKYTLTWFEGSVITDVAGPGYQAQSFVLDSLGNTFLFSMTKNQTAIMPTQEYLLVVVDPIAGSVTPHRALIGESLSFKYYNSHDDKLLYNKKLDGREVGVVGNSQNEAEQIIGNIESISVFPNDVVIGSYTPSNALVFSSVNAPGQVRLTLSPDGGYSLISPTVARSVDGTYTAYHLWKPGSRDGVVRVVQTDTNAVVEEAVQGSVEMFFSPDGKRLFIIEERAGSEGIVTRRGIMVDLAESRSAEITLPMSIHSVIDWY